MRKVLPLLLIVISLGSCQAISSLMHDDQVVAKAGEYKLYRSELSAYIPGTVSPEDSVKLAARYIDSWASEHLFLSVAEQQLSKEEKDVTQELEDYRRSLLKYRYEQRYINERLDTLVTDEQIREYYVRHKEDFGLSRPLMKVRFVQMMKDSPSRETILKMMSSSEYDDLQRADTLAASSAIKYLDNSDIWMDSGELAGLFGLAADDMLARYKDGFIRFEPEGRGDMMAAYVCDMLKSGYAPVEYCSARIHDIILSARKRDLVRSLEQDLLTDATRRKQLIIY